MEKQILNKIDQLQERLIQDIKRMVQIDSVEQPAMLAAPFGEGVKKALTEALTISHELGFETTNMDHYIGYASWGKSTDYICAIGHLDVVPVGTGWKHPPFSAFEEDGFIYGRGVLDNKGPILSCLYALYALKELGIEMEKEVRIIFGCDEETGFKDLEYYLSKEKPPVMGFTPDCKYPVVYGERGRAVIRITAALDQYQKFFDYLNTYFMNAKNNGETLGIDFRDQEFGILEMRGYHLDSDDQHLYFDFTLSYPSGVTLEILMDKIKETCPFGCECTKHYSPVRFEKDSFLVHSLQKAYEEVTGKDGTPVTTTGGTYAKLMPNIVPFGPSFPGQKGIAHLPNEWMKIEDIIANAKIYALSFYYLNAKKGKESYGKDC